MMMELVLATGNPHKLEEMRKLFVNVPVIRVVGPETVGGMPPVEETADTFAGNALLKAQALQAVSGQRAVLADDSGLEVAALEGQPGVYSARYAGAEASDADNVKKLLESMKEVPEKDRQAAFVCVLCLLCPGTEPMYYEGRVEGTIGFEPCGESGFGYDPVFYPEGHQATFAELGPEVKNQISHRSRALRKLQAAFTGRA